MHLNFDHVTKYFSNIKKFEIAVNFKKIYIFLKFIAISSRLNVSHGGFKIDLWHKHSNIKTINNMKILLNVNLLNFQKSVSNVNFMF